MNATVSGLIAIGMWANTALLFVAISHLPVFELGFMLFFIGFCVLTAKQMARHENLISYWKRPLSDYAFWILGAGSYTLLVFYSYAHVAIFEANILNYLWPILLIALSTCLHQEKLKSSVIIGMVLGFLGVITIFMPANSAAFFSDFRFGHAVAIFTAFMWATYSAFARRKTYPVGFLAPAFFVFSMMCLFMHIAFETTVLPRGLEWLFIALSGIARVSYAFWDYGMKHGNVIFLASVSYFLPLLSSLMLAAFGYGTEQPFIMLGSTLIIVGCLCVNAGHLKHLLQNIGKPA